MISIDMIPTERKVVIEIPEEMVNKPIHVDIRPKGEGGKPGLPKPDPQKLEEMKAWFNRFHVDLSNFKFDRDEANER
jgi:hypothetical protein